MSSRLLILFLSFSFLPLNQAYSSKKRFLSSKNLLKHKHVHSNHKLGSGIKVKIKPNPNCVSSSCLGTIFAFKGFVLSPYQFTELELKWLSDESIKETLSANNVSFNLSELEEFQNKTRLCIKNCKKKCDKAEKKQCRKEKRKCRRSCKKNNPLKTLARFEFHSEDQRNVRLSVKGKTDQGFQFNFVKSFDLNKFVNKKLGKKNKRLNKRFLQKNTNVSEDPFSLKNKLKSKDIKSYKILY